MTMALLETMLTPPRHIAGLTLLMLACNGGAGSRPPTAPAECVSLVEEVVVLDGIHIQEGPLWHDGKLAFFGDMTETLDTAIYELPDRGGQVAAPYGPYGGPTFWMEDEDLIFATYSDEFFRMPIAGGASRNCWPTARPAA